jgi:hypothetical protein
MANSDIKLSPLASVYAGEMLIATSAAALVVASSLAAGAVAPVPPAPLPIAVTVSAASNVRPSIVALAIAETDAIFRSAGVSFAWSVGAPALTLLTVSIGNESGIALDGRTALGWIAFDDDDRPEQEIYLSYANAERFLRESRDVTGPSNNMTLAERELLLGRAMGRALAHELAHYLLATKIHTARGLLKAVRSSQEFFSFDRSRFQLEPVQRMQIADRVRAEALVASQQKPAGPRRSRGASH